MKKIFYHLLISTVSLLLIFSFLAQTERFNPIIKALKEISFSDIYFSFMKDQIPSKDIYIVDIGFDNPETTRVNITNFINEVNSKYKPSVIGVDVFFDTEVNKKIDLNLSKALSEKNVVRIFKMVEKNFNENSSIIYPDFGSLPNLDTNTFEKDGYTFGLGDATEHPCVRYFKPRFSFKNTTYNHFSTLVARKHLKFENKDFNNSLNLKNKMMINYNRGFSSNRISINDTNKYSELKGKIVLLAINTYNNDGFPLYNEDVHYTPKNKYYIGRSEKDSYGIEIIAQIISNFINDEHLFFKEVLMNYINIFISLFSYLFLLYVFIYYNKFFVIFKILSQTFGALTLVISSLLFIHYNNFYIDLTFSIAILLISGPVIELVEGVLKKTNSNFLKNFK